MKRTLIILLVLLLLATLVPGALAADKVMVSRQNLRVDGKVIACEKYNINNSNYFKLRDLAALLNGTGSQFDVDYDAATGTMIVTTGVPYTHPNGTELKIGADNSGTAKVSSQKLSIDGKDCSDLVPYNIGNVNFFKLRDLDKLLGYFVDYDIPSDTAIIISKVPSYPIDWLTEEWTSENNTGTSYGGASVYNEDGYILRMSYWSSDYREEETYSYDELGRLTEYRCESVSAYGGEETPYTTVRTQYYNLWGQLEHTVSQSTGDYVSEDFYTYDDRGNQLECRTVSNSGETIYTSVYDENDNLIKSEYRYGDDYCYGTLYTRDAQGRILKEQGYNSSGYTYTDEYVYTGDRLTQVVYVSGDYRSTTTYTYDDRGNCIHYSVVSNDSRYEVNTVYDENDLPLREESNDGNDGSVTTYAYDAQGRQIREETVYDSGARYLYEYTYDAQGNMLTSFSEEDGIVTRTSFSYDQAARKKTSSISTVYPRAMGMELSWDSLELAVGEYRWLYASFLPYNALQEEVVWSSSDPGVVTVDEDGYIEAVAEGEAVIAAVSENGFRAECSVTVTAAAEPEPTTYTLTADREAVAVRLGRTISVTCNLKRTGDWQPNCVLSADNYDHDLISVSWDRSEWTDEIGLEITGLETGTTYIDVFVKVNGEYTGDVVTISVTVVN